MIVGGRYTLRAAIGNGGMGTVWRGTDTLLRRDVAVKEVAPPVGVSAPERDAMYERMMREARAAAVISHPSVVQVYDVVTDGGRPWIVMELLDARSLADIVVSDGPLAPRAVAKIGVAMLGALEMAHAAGVLHRDVKPANVLICTDGRPVLTDFGVARMPTDQQLTTPGMVLGSPHFISPERAMGAPFGPPSDLFSLGVTLYAAIEGQPPFDKGDAIGTMHSVVEDPPRPAERAGVLAEVLDGLLEKDPARRWDAATARQALRDLLAGPLASATPHFPTDPYAVVPTNPPYQAPATHQASGQVGGRAMLPPAGGRPAPAPTSQRTNAYEQVPDPYRRPQEEYRSRSARHHRGGPAREPAAVVAQARQTVTRVATQAWDSVRRLPRNVRVAGAAGLAAVIVIGSIVLVTTRGGDDPPLSAGGQNPGTDQTAAPDEGPQIAVQEFADREIVVNLPEGWEETDSSAIRVDFGDPADPGNRRLRLLFEPTTSDSSTGFVQVAEGFIEQNCPEPYERVSLDEIEVAGEPATRLEYTCGSGGEGRHALWASVIRDGTAYSFFVTLPPDSFDETEAIFAEMVRSFQFT